MLMQVGVALSQEHQPARGADLRCFAFELHVRDADQEETALSTVMEALDGRDGITLRVFNHLENEGIDRHRQICNYFKLPTDTFPLIYGCGQAISVLDEPASVREEIDALTTMTVFVREGCRHCAAGEAFLEQIAPTYPGLIVRYRVLGSDSAAARDVQSLADRYGQRAASVPVFHYCNQLTVGFDRADTTGRQIQRVLEGWSFACPDEDDTQSDSAAPKESTNGKSRQTQSSVSVANCGVAWPAMAVKLKATVDEEQFPSGSAQEDMLPLPPLPGGEADLLPLPLDDDGGVATQDSDADADADSIDLPFFGQVSAEAIGLPLFTIMVGLVDGFNPCAMWVLLFMLSILVNLKDRWKILAVAGSFVLISGVAYFAFMAAWLSVFQLIGLLRPAQVMLGLLAVGIGAVHVKDFFAFKKGLSLSIPESVKPTIYSRIRHIVNAETLWGAVIGAATLAVLVNIVELLCTAGLPAMYTGILSTRDLPAWQEYAYLGLYIVAYMFDDSLMVAIVVVTLGRHKLQEREGRWLKLVSGAFILALGLIMIIRPEWLV